MRRKLTVVGIALAFVIVWLWFISRLIAWGSCSWYGYQTDRDTRYAAFVGCMVRVNNAWVPRNELRVMQ